MFTCTVCCTDMCACTVTCTGAQIHVWLCARLYARLYAQLYAWDQHVHEYIVCTEICTDIWSLYNDTGLSVPTKVLRLRQFGGVLITESWIRALQQKFTRATLFNHYITAKPLHSRVSYVLAAN